MVLPPGGKTHETRFQVPGQGRAAAGARRGAIEPGLAGADERHGQSRAGAQSPTPGRSAGHRDFDRRQAQLGEDQSGQSGLLRAGELQGRPRRDRRVALTDAVDTATVGEPHRDRQVHR